jgi:integrase
MGQQQRDNQPVIHLTRHGQQWYYSFFCDGRRYRGPCGRLGQDTETAAREAASQVARDVVAQLERAKNRTDQQNPIKAYRERLNQRSESHQENHARFLVRFREYFRDTPVTVTTRDGRVVPNLTRADVEGWRDWLLTTAKRKDLKTGHLSRKTVKEHIDWLAAIYNDAGVENPCRNVERPRKKHSEQVVDLEFFTPDEMALMFEAARQHFRRNYNGFVFLALTGCRVEGAQGLRPEHLDHTNQIVWVTEKGAKTRPLKLVGPAQPAWDALLDELRRPKPHGYIFSQSPTWARKLVDRVCRRAFGVTMPDGRPATTYREMLEGAPNRCGHPHMLRHSFASLALMHWRPAWDITVLAKWLGHRDINTTYKIYGHWIAQAPPSGYDWPVSTQNQP